MLSYQHEFHAGNAADVFKHAVLLAILEKLLEKPRPLGFFDSHAGRGLYDLTSDQANKTGEYQTGIAKLIKMPAPPLWAEGLLTALRQTPENKVSENKAVAAHDLRYYAGSILLAAQRLAQSPPDQGDHAITAIELHPQEIKALRQALSPYHHSHIHQRDSWEAIRALCPPRTTSPDKYAPRRGLVLIDPPYEIKQDYQSAVDAVQYLTKSWREAVIMLWYPCLKDQREQMMVTQLKQWLDANPDISYWHGEAMTAPSASGYSLIGSGLWLIRPPFGTDAQLTQILNGWQKLYG